MDNAEYATNFPFSLLTLRHVLEHNNRCYSLCPALSFIGEEPLLYGDFYNSVLAVSQFLGEHGIGFGDAVAILSENSPNWVISYFAVTSMGAVAVPILVDFHPQAVQHILRHSEAKAVFVSEKLMSKLGNPGALPSMLFVNMESFRAISLGMPGDKFQEIKDAGVREFRKFRAKARRVANLTPREPREDDVAAIIYTSGTTGFSKGVVLTHRNIIYNALLVQGVFNVSHADRFLSFLPLAHTYECTMGMVLPVLFGAQIAYLNKPPTARVLLPALASFKPTAVPSVPLVIEKIYRNSIKPKFTSSTLMRKLYAIPFFRRLLHRMAGRKLSATFGGCIRAFAIGGAPLSPEVDQFLYESGFRYAIGYGLTENAPLVAGMCWDNAKRGSCGQIMTGLLVRIGDPDPQTGVGEVLVKGPTVMREYYKEPELTEAVLDEDGWLHTGDMGIIDSEGFLFLRGRNKNVLLGPSGENIYPEEVEAVLQGIDVVQECVVYMQDNKLMAKVYLDMEKLDEKFGDLTAARRIEVKSELLETLRQEANVGLAAFARLQKIVEQPEPFEKTPTQKIKRYLYVHE